MQIHYTADDYSPFHITLADYLVRRNRMQLDTGSPKIREARHEGYQTGRREMMCEVIAHEVNRRRILTFSMWKQVPIINSIDSRKELKLIEDAYDAAHELVDENKVNGAKAVNWDSFFKMVEVILDGSAITNEMKADELRRHREAVVNGHEEPDETDIAWLTEEQGKASDEVRRLRNLTMKAEKKLTS